MPWQVSYYESGTTNVDTGNPAVPHLHVFAYPSEDAQDMKDATNHHRLAICHQICDFLNGGKRPGWLDDMDRVTLDQLVGSDGSRISANGPYYDADPPSCDWKERDDEDAKEMRRQLIDMLAINGPQVD